MYCEGAGSGRCEGLQHTSYTHSYWDNFYKTIQELNIVGTNKSQLALFLHHFYETTEDPDTAKIEENQFSTFRDADTALNFANEEIMRMMDKKIADHQKAGDYADEDFRKAKQSFQFTQPAWITYRDAWNKFLLVRNPGFIAGQAHIN